MGSTTKIEWADATWNPWYGCTKLSIGCENCYAEREMKRFGKDFNAITRSKTTFRDPLKWKEPRMIFVCSWGDFFHPDVPDEWRSEAWEIMYHAKEHTFLILTKRPENMPLMMPVGWTAGMWRYMPNIWLGVTVESPSWRGRIGFLRLVPAAVHFLSCEPLLGGLDLDLEHIEWVIVGGESGPDYRTTLFEWVVDIRDQCVKAGIPFFFKQWGGKGNKRGGNEALLEGRLWHQLPSKPA